MNELQSKSNNPQKWSWRSVLEDTYSDLFGIYLSYCLPDENEVKESFKNVLDSIKKLEFCEYCGKISRNIYKKNLFTTGFTICSRMKGLPDGFGFTRPCTISPELREFCEIYGPLPGEITRVDITKLVCRHIKEKCLIDQENKALFTPDEKLSRLLGTTAQINYFTLQRYLSSHFTRSSRLPDICDTYPMFKTGSSRPHETDAIPTV